MSLHQTPNTSTITKKRELSSPEFSDQDTKKTKASSVSSVSSDLEPYLESEISDIALDISSGNQTSEGLSEHCSMANQEPSQSSQSSAASHILISPSEMENYLTC